MFACVFGYNLARPMSLAKQTDIFLRLFWVAVLASLVYIPLFGAWPLNILFTMAAAMLVVDFLDRMHYRAPVVFLLFLGCLVDYVHFGVLLVVGFWLYAKQPGIAAAAVLALAFSGMALINPRGWWSLLALPALAMATRVDLAVPRWRWIFLGIYVAHLVALLLWAQV